MLRALIVLLLVANLAVFGWSQGWFAPVLARPGQGEREPERLARQVNPGAIRVLGTQDARSAMAEAVQQARATAASASSQAAATPEAPASGASAAPASAAQPAVVAAGPACLETTALAQAELAAADRALRSLQMPALRWSTVRSERGGLFIVYMGRYTDRPTIQKKQDELRGLGVPFTELADAPPLMPGLELGRFKDRNAANAALAQMSQRGVRSARVAMLVAPELLAQLRVDRADAVQAERVRALQAPPAPAPLFRPCVVPAPAAASAAR